MAAHYVLTNSKDGQVMFNLKAANGQVILTSERYTTKSAAEGGIESVRRNSALDERYERRENSKGEPYFILKAGNSQEIGRRGAPERERAIHHIGHSPSPLS